MLRIFGRPTKAIVGVFFPLLFLLLFCFAHRLVFEFPIAAGADVETNGHARPIAKFELTNHDEMKIFMN